MNYYSPNNFKLKKSWKFSGSCPQAISIQSSGGSKLWNNRLGHYDLVRYDSSGNAIYEHSYNKGKFLYKIKEDDSHWMVSRLLNIFFKANSNNWWYRIVLRIKSFSYSGWWWDRQRLRLDWSCRLQKQMSKQMRQEEVAVLERKNKQ